MQPTKGIIMFNRGDQMVVRAIVCLYSLRKHYNGPINFYVEEEYPHEFDEVLKYFNCNIVKNETRHDMRTLVRKSSLLENLPFDLTLWIDLDTIIMGPIDNMFNYLETQNADLCIPSWCGWKTNGKTMTKRTMRFEGIADPKYIYESLKDHKAVNTGIMSFKRSEKLTNFLKDVTKLAQKGGEKRIFIPDETAMNILYPSMHEWGLKYYICETDYNVSPLHDHGMSKSPVIAHFHGDKHVLDVPLCDIWKNHFKEALNANVANIKHFVEKYSDKRLKKYLGNMNGSSKDVTIVTACDEKYVEYLKLTFPNWRKYKNIDNHPVLVFVNGIPLSDNRLDFLRLPNVKLVEWDMPHITDHREKMLNAFVFGTAEHVQTDYWLKLDSDSFATDNRPLYSEDMKQYAFCGHKWGYSRPDHIKKLDEWAKSHHKRKLRNAAPMLEQGKIEGNRFYHNKKRTISFIQLHKTKFTKFCVKLLKEKRLPVPSQDTYMFFVCDRFDPQFIGVRNFKKNHGFTQGNSRLGVEVLKNKIFEIEKNIATNQSLDQEEDFDSFEKKIDKDFESNNAQIGQFLFADVNLNYQIKNIQIKEKL